MFRSMSDEHDLHVHPPQPQAFRFTFKRRFRSAEVYEDVIGSQIVGELFMLTFDGGRAVGVPIRGADVRIEPMP